MLAKVVLVLSLAVVCLVATASAGIAKPPAILHSPEVTSIGDSETVRFIASPRARFCQVRFSRAGSVDGPYKWRARKRFMTLRWKVARSARGVWKVGVGCGRTRRDARSLGEVSHRLAIRIRHKVDSVATGQMVTRSSLRRASRKVPARYRHRHTDSGLANAFVDPAFESLPAEGQGGPRPDLRLPFGCGETGWKATTYSGHGHALDWNLPGNADAGRPAVASAAGTAYLADHGNRSYGKHVVVDHGGGWSTIYAHLSSFLVGHGAGVARGTPVGTIGNTGYSFGAHLHYEQRWARQAQPIAYSGGMIVAGRPYTSDNCQPSAGPAPAPPAQGPQAPRRTITVYNKVTNGATQMREDTTPVRLLTKPWTHCTSRGCNINGTERGTDGTYDAAVCQLHGERTTNGHDGSALDDGNPGLFSSTRYYGVRLTNGTFGYVSETWIHPNHRGGLGLPAC